MHLIESCTKKNKKNGVDYVVQNGRQNHRTFTYVRLSCTSSTWTNMTYVPQHDKRSTVTGSQWIKVTSEIFIPLTPQSIQSADRGLECLLNHGGLSEMRSQERSRSNHGIRRLNYNKDEGTYIKSETSTQIRLVRSISKSPLQKLIKFIVQDRKFFLDSSQQV